MSLDNTSCNLASLNLMKFLNDDFSFDIANFTKAVELIITAMDISICFADFPTEAIAVNTRAYRQLGIGYANLGALLMASTVSATATLGSPLRLHRTRFGRIAIVIALAVYGATVGLWGLRWLGYFGGPVPV